jgi:2-methylcitrate dehydratase PrpD
MCGTAKSTPIEELSANVLDTRFENFDQATLDNAKSRIIDVVGCLIGGANAAGNSALIDLVKEWGGKEEATILIHGGKVPAHNAAMVNSIMARSFDFEALCPLVEDEIIPAHTSGTTIPTAITMGEMKGVNGKELITALLVGDNVASRVLAASGFVPTLGWDCIGTTNMMGATAIAGRLLALNERQMRNAFGIVLNQLAGSSQSIWDGTTAFKLAQGISARNGIFSAHLAKAGWTGPDDALLSRFGYYHLYTEGCINPEILTKDLGKKYYADAVFKPYPCCRGTHPAIDCALTLLQQHDIKAEDIVEVTIYIPAGGVGGFLEQPFKIGDFPHTCAIFSYQYTVANALLRKSVKPEHFSEASIRDPQVNALIKKIKLAELPGVPTLSAKLTVKMKDRREFSEFNDSPKGDPVRNPMPKDEIVDKFRANVDFSQTVSRDNAQKVLELLENLEELDSVNKIVELLVPYSHPKR